MFNFMRGPVYGGDGTASGGAGGGDTAPPAHALPAATPPNNGAAPPAPWAAAGENLYTLGDKPWWEAVPEAPVKELLSQKQYKNPAILATAYYNLNKEFSADSRVAIPSENATPDDINNFYTKLGRPPSPAAYDEKLFTPPEGVAADPKMVEFGRQVAFELGLNPKQTAKLGVAWHKMVTDRAAAEVEAYQKTNDAEIEAVKKTWGVDGDTYIADGKRAYATLGMDVKLASRIEAAVGSGAMLELFARLGRATREGTFKAGGSGGGAGSDPNGMTPGQAQVEIERLQSDDGFQKQYTNRMDPGNRAAVERMQQLFARAEGKTVS